jgi:hypothetical protein
MAAQSSLIGSVRTLVISDLHLGTSPGRDVLRRPEPLAQLCDHLTATGVERLVLLGDTVEMRHGPLRTALAVAEPVLAAVGAAMGEDGLIVLIPGNHDHQLVAPWLEARGADATPPPLGLEEHPAPDGSWGLARLAAAARPARLDVAHPGIWLREDVYAMHGHYLDRFLSVPTFERLAAGVMTRIVGPVADPATPGDFEAALAPLYAWLHALAQTPAGSWSAHRQNVSARSWALLNHSGRGTPLRARALSALFPVGVAGANLAGLGPVHARVGGEDLRRAGLEAISEVVRRLRIPADHVLFGHTHRAGPLPADDHAEWHVTGTRTRLHNAGGWIDEPAFAPPGPESPYWGGRAIELDPEPGTVPRLVRVATELGAPPRLREARPARR